MPSIVSFGLRLIRISKNTPYALEYSDNAGIRWQSQYAGAEDTGLFQELFRRGEMLYAISSKGKFRSVDGGASWMQI